MEPSLFERIHQLYLEMQKEIGREEEIDQHILRAMLYETLMLLSRAEFSDKTRAVFSEDEMSPSRYADKFKSLVADNYKSEHRTEYYSDRLFITPNYLNRIIRRTLGKSAKETIGPSSLTGFIRTIPNWTNSITRSIPRKTAATGLSWISSSGNIPQGKE